MGSVKCDEKRELLDEDYASGPDTFPVLERDWIRRGPAPRFRPLWKRVKAAVAIGCVCFLSYGLISLSHSTFDSFR